MTTTPGPKAAEQVIFATLLQTLGEPNDRVAHKIDQALKAAGLLVGAPTDGGCNGDE